jgi:uncharacterized membrane protein YsdA (DUF1294 family)
MLMFLLGAMFGGSFGVLIAAMMFAAKADELGRQE